MRRPEPMKPRPARVPRIFPRPRAGWWRGAAPAASVLLLAGQFWRVPELAGLDGSPAEGVRLVLPASYLLLAPWCVLADRLSLMSVEQWAALGAWLAAAAVGLVAAGLGGGPRGGAKGLGRAAALGLAAAAAVAWTAWWDRPMVRLETDDPDLLAFNIHSHTSASWDGREGYGPAQNRAWHARAGFHAGFITDHNVWSASLESAAATPGPYEETGYLSLVGSELSLSNLHLVALGCPEPMDARDFGEYEGLGRAIRRLHACGGAAVPSLPEYWEHHWDSLERLAELGADGFEALNAPPKALSFPASGRLRVLELCRGRGLAALAATDSHGYGAAPPGWNLARLPGWRRLGRQAVQDALVRELRAARVRVVARPRVEPEGRLALAADPLFQLVLALRSTPLPAALAVLPWLWLPRLLRRRARGDG